MAHRIPPFIATTALILAGCTGIPDGTRAVGDFELDRYLGRWYEIARLDHSFEEGLDCVTADYSRRDDGGVDVINRGVNLETGEVEVADGKAYPQGEADVGRLKVSFFGPFYAGYNVLELDDDYDRALVAGPDRGYLWILSRTPQMMPERFTTLRERARELDFPVDELILVAQGDACEEWRRDA
jgi:apolipoprotein D and lipocalin family protein